MDQFADEITNALTLIMGDLAPDLVERGCRKIGTSYAALAPEDFERLMIALREMLELIYPPSFVDIVVTKMILAIQGRY